MTSGLFVRSSLRIDLIALSTPAADQSPALCAADDPGSNAGIHLNRPSAAAKPSTSSRVAALAGTATEIDSAIAKA
ncbi:MAG: hypothetical protein ACSLFF_04485 [Solirubrobacterales bacterium]